MSRQDFAMSVKRGVSLALQVLGFVVSMIVGLGLIALCLLWTAPFLSVAIYAMRH